MDNKSHLAMTAWEREYWALEERKEMESDTGSAKFVMAIQWIIVIFLLVLRPPYFCMFMFSMLFFMGMSGWMCVFTKAKSGIKLMVVANMLTLIVCSAVIIRMAYAEHEELIAGLKRGEHSVMVYGGKENRRFFAAGVTLSAEEDDFLRWNYRYLKKFSFPLKYPVQINGHDMIVEVRLTNSSLFATKTSFSFAKMAKTAVAALKGTLSDTPKERLPKAVSEAANVFFRDYGLSATAKFVK